jgi:hypothetical protein
MRVMAPSSMIAALLTWVIGEQAPPALLKA